MLTVENESMLGGLEEAEMKNPTPRRVRTPERTVYTSRNRNNPKNHT